MKKLLLLSSTLLFIGGCDVVFPNQLDVAREHVDVCLDDERPLIQCYDLLHSLDCQVQCLPRRSKIKECMKMLITKESTPSDIVRFYDHCREPIVRWGTTRRKNDAKSSH